MNNETFDKVFDAAETLETEVRQLRGRINELETRIGWYKAVNAQLRDDLAEANADFKELARVIANSKQQLIAAASDTALDAIVLGLRKENNARKPH